MVGASGRDRRGDGRLPAALSRARVDVLFFFIIFFRIFPIPAWIMLGLWFAMQIFSGIVDPRR